MKEPISRRDFVASASTAAAVLGASGSVTFLTPDPAAADAATRAGFYRFNVGDIEVTTLFDGIWEKPHDPAFIRNATVDETKAALRAAGMDDSKVTIPFTITLVKMGGKTIMFDSGTGAQLSPLAGRLAASMATAGIDPKSISTIVVTHFHPDHIFGLMAKDTNAQVYPDAEIVVPEAELKFWSDPGVFARLPEANRGLAQRIQATLAKWKNVRPIAGEAEAAPGITALPAYGHTPGHTVYQVGSGKDQLLVLADVTNIPALFARHPDWHPVFDADPIAAEANRRKFFDRAIADNVIMTGYHYGAPGAGRMSKDGAGYVFAPLV